ncbi:MAG: HAD family hydrolase [Anaerolineales bacterium]
MSLILFDFDGVLADTLDDLLQFGQEVCNELGVHHYVVKEDLNNLEVMSFATFGKQLEVPDALIEKFVQRCLEKVAEKESPPAMFAGLAEVVRELSTRHVLGIVTTNSTQNVKAFLAQHELEDCIRVIYGVDQPGTKAEKIVRAQEQFAVESEAVFMIGDAVSDILAAKQALVKSIAASWGHQNLDRLTKAKPDYIVHSAGEIIEIVNQA